MSSRAGIIALVPESWDAPPRTARHHLLEKLATHLPVVWVDPARLWREYLPRPGKPHKLPAPLPCPNRLSVLRASLFAPKVYSPPWLSRAFDRHRLSQARRMLTRQGVDRVVLYLWRPEFASALPLVAHDLSCYHIDDEYSFSPEDKGLDQAEAALIRRVDQVFIHSHALMEKKGSLNPNTLLAPNGVDYEAFAAPRREPADLAPIPHPRVGYVGVIKRHLDLDLMLQVVVRQPEFSFVFVGPVLSIGDQRGALDALMQRPNCHFVGAKRSEDLPGYMQHLDVGLLCYRVDGYTRYIYPLKLHEYLASGLPVVGSPIPALSAFKDIILSADSVDAWSASIAAAAATSRRDAAQVARRRAAARAHDWEGLVSNIAATIEARLAAKPAADPRTGALASTG